MDNLDRENNLIKSRVGMELKTASVRSSAIKVLFNMCGWQVKATIYLTKHSYLHGLVPTCEGTHSWTR